MKDQQFEYILSQALRPEIDDSETTVRCRKIRKGNHMSMKQVIKKVCIAAAVVAVLTTTAYASGAVNFETLVSGKTSKTYETVQQAEERAGFEMDSVDHFTNGYGFAGARVEETKALDEKDKVRLTYNEIHVELKNAAGDRLRLIAYEHQEGIVDSELPPDQTRKIGDFILKYRLHHYKFVPENYVQTEADKAMLQQPGYFMSYGSETTVEENDVAFLNWEKDGICYTLMDTDASESADSLFSMAGELILRGK